MKWIVSYLLIFSILSGCRGRTADIPTTNAVADLLSVEIGGMQQWILIRGENHEDPILLWLHGGPGSAQMPIHHTYTKELEKEFVVVHWDQRGAGKSNHSGFREETMTMERFIRDTLELTQYLKARFDKKKIYLLGHSWGSLLGLHLVNRVPGDYHAFISVSQVVHPQKADKTAFQWLLQQVLEYGSKKQKQTLSKLGDPPFTEHQQFVKFIAMLDSYGGGVDASFTELFWKSLGAREYTFTDYLRWFNGANRGSGPMWEETRNVDLFSSIDSLFLPVYFFTGQQDYNTPHPLVKEYYEFLEAPLGKYLVSFTHSAHTPFIAEPEKFIREVTSVKYQTGEYIP